MRRNQIQIGSSPTLVPARTADLQNTAGEIWRRLRRGAFDAVFPPRCLMCGAWDCSGEPSLCPPCTALIDAERAATACPVCAADLAPHSLRNGRCPECHDRPVHVSGVVRVGRWRPIGADLSPIGRLLRDYKFRGQQVLGPALGAWLAEAVREAEWSKRIEVIVAVPTHWARRLRRPFYPADELADLLGAQLDLPVVPVLRRVRGGKRQVGLSYSQRQINIRRAFAVRRGFAFDGTRVLLVDDVRTTGATLDECARVLHKAGAAEIHAAVIARAGWRHLAGQKITGV